MIKRLCPQKLIFAAIIALALAGTSCKGTNPAEFDVTCESCRNDGQTCDVSYNCQAGSICNSSDEELFDPAKTDRTCIKVVCNTNADCEGTKTCSLEKICNNPVCQVDGDCSPGTRCIAGACNPAPSVDNVTTCEIATRNGSIRQGTSLTLVAVAKNANGAVLPTIPFTWMSDKANVVSVDANGVATGGSEQGRALITAQVKDKASVNCAGLELTNFPQVPMADLRVVIIEDDTGSPIQGADITAVSGANTNNAQTDGNGAALVVGGGQPNSITIIKAGYQYVSVLSPGTNDILVPLPRVPDETKAGGFRGSVDISATKSADIKLGIAGPSLPSNLLDFGLEALIGDPVKTVINAPELSLNNEEVDLPGGVMLGLGNKMFTNDMGGARCQGDEPGPNELGCYVARAPKGKGAAWVLAGQLKLSEVTPIATQLSGALGGGGGDLPIGDILTAVLPLLRSLNHGINASVETEEFAKVPTDAAMPVDCTVPSNASNGDKCRGDFAKYTKIDLAASQKLGVLSTVSVPNQPVLKPGNAACAGASVLVAAAILPGRGVLPLGLSAGVDVLDKEAPDCKVGGVKHPFGENSADLHDGQMPLTMAPPHSGIEGSKIALLVLALDPNSISGALQLNAVVSRVDSVGEQQNLGALSYLAYPAGAYSKAARTFTFTQQPTGATATRFEIQRGNETWLVYAPVGASVTLPNTMTTNDVLDNAGSAYVQAVKISGAYTDLWNFGSGKTLDNFVNNLDAFVVQQCLYDPGVPAHAESPCNTATGAEANACDSGYACMAGVCHPEVCAIGN